MWLYMGNLDMINVYCLQFKVRYDIVVNLSCMGGFFFICVWKGKEKKIGSFS